MHKQAQYFVPQIETKIMNEGWASFWHKRILEALDLPQGPASGIHHAPYPSAAPLARRPQSLSCRHENLGGHRKALGQPEQAEEIEEFGPRKKTGKRKAFRSPRSGARLRRFCAVT